MNFRKQIRPPLLSALIFLLGIGLLSYTLAFYNSPVQAAPAHQTDKPGNDYCLACHQDESLTKSLGSETLSAHINPTQFELSVHSAEGLVCVDCHTDISEYPHPEVKSKSIREFQISFSETCKDCHEDQFSKAHDSVHQSAMEEGNINAPLCADCHNPHTQARIIGENSGQLTIAARKEIPATCANCHTDIYTTYEASVHGGALADGNTDVPTCTDCHGVHNIQSLDTAFHNNTPALCGDCHTNSEIMDKYGLSTNVVNTYVADFHGKTVKLFEEQFPGQPTNKAVCTDCHGVHDIAKVNDPETGIALKDNLLIKCQRCHPDATANFPDAWMSHYEPSPEHFPIVYYVNLFYKIFIPLVLGGMTFFVLTDIYRRIINSRKGIKHS